MSIASQLSGKKEKHMAFYKPKAELEQRKQGEETPRHITVRSLNRASLERKSQIFIIFIIEYKEHHERYN